MLIDRLGHARLTDYGFAPINHSINLTAADPTAGNMVWLAPEIIKPETPGALLESKPADVFAFSMLVFEVFTGKLPFEGKGRSRAAHRIVNGDRPKFPQGAEDIGLTTQVWEFLEEGWHMDPEERPTIEEVVRTWGGFLGNGELVQRTPNDQGHGEPVPDEGHLLGGQQTRPGQHLLSSAYIASLLM